jgi:hypothetical protein
MEAALMEEGTRYPYGFNRIRSTPSQSPDGSVFSVPTRGWESQSASVISAPIGGSRIPRGIPQQNLFFCVPGQATSSRTVLTSQGRIASKPRTIVLSITRPRPLHRWISRIHLLPACAQRRSL